MTPEQRKMWLPMVVLVVALVAWSGMLALGAFLQMGADQPHHDWRRPLIVMGCMAAFLGVWGVALWKRSRRPS
jgi:hypothetical protein